MYFVELCSLVEITSILSCFKTINLIKVPGK